MDSAHIEATAMELMAECQRLRDEIGRLRQVLTDNDIDPDPIVPKREAPSPSNPPSVNLTTPQKIELFRSLFRGRHGYSPVAQRDWKAYNAASIEDRKRVDKETRKYVPLTDQSIHDHLSGKQTLGVYPLLRDETCWFLAVDFDKKSWQKDTAAFLKTCHDFHVPAALERSRSGKGGHIWIFFERPMAAMVARKLGALLLTRTMERRHQLGLDSYDRFFPNQDTMPKGGFGNLRESANNRSPIMTMPKKS